MLLEFEVWSSHPALGSRTWLSSTSTRPLIHSASPESLGLSWPKSLHSMPHDFWTPNRWIADLQGSTIDPDRILFQWWPLEVVHAGTMLGTLRTQILDIWPLPPSPWRKWAGQGGLGPMQCLILTLMLNRFFYGYSKPFVACVSFFFIRFEPQWHLLYFPIASSSVIHILQGGMAIRAVAACGVLSCCMCGRWRSSSLGPCFEVLWSW